MKTRNLFIAALVVLTTSVTGCSSGLESETMATETADSPDSIKSNPVEQYISASDSFKAQVANQSSAQPNGQTTTAANLPALNPKHGQPGHNCDLEVGAPLNSAPSKSPSVAAQPAITTSANNPQPAINSKNTAGLNPAHGQPGHKCEIAVGAPLNSSPASATPTSTPVTTTSTPLPKTNAGNVRLNPAHGQPGHDCAVEVGQPLKN